MSHNLCQVTDILRLGEQIRQRIEVPEDILISYGYYQIFHLPFTVAKRIGMEAVHTEILLLGSDPYAEVIFGKLFISKFFGNSLYIFFLIMGMNIIKKPVLHIKGAAVMKTEGNPCLI